MNSEQQEPVCIKRFTPVIIALGVLLVIVIAWTVYIEVTCPARQLAAAGPGAVPVPAQGKRVAAGAGQSPISIGQSVPHADYGQNCLSCHTLAAPDQKDPIPAGPIAATAVMTHPFWGTCQKCHEIVNAPPVATAAAYVGMLAGKNLFGAELVTITPGLATQYNLPTEQGVVVNAVAKGSLAENAGLQEGDIITSVDNTEVRDATDLSQSLAGKQEGDRLKLKIIRNKTRTKNIKLKLQNIKGLTASPADTIGIMVAGTNLQSQVAYSFINAPFLLVYDLSNDTYFSKTNPYRGLAGNKISNWVAEQNVGAVIAGNINEEESLNLANSDIKVFSGVFGSGNDAVSLYKEGQLIQDPNLGLQAAAFAVNTVNTVAVPANFPDPSSNVSATFSGAQYFIIVQLDQNRYEVKRNPNFNNPNPNYVRAAHFLVDQNVDGVIVNTIGADALAELKKLNMKVVTNADMSVGDAVMKFKNGEFKLKF